MNLRNPILATMIALALLALCACGGASNTTNSDVQATVSAAVQATDTAKANTQATIDASVKATTAAIQSDGASALSTPNNPSSGVPTQEATKNAPATTPPATDTAVPVATTVPTSDTTANATLLAQDDFSSTASGWLANADTQRTLQYANGQYEMKLADTYNGGWNSIWRDGPFVHDLSMEADVTFSQGAADAHFGLVCRSASSDSDYYIFTIAAGGHWYLIARYDRVNDKYIRLAAYQPQNDAPSSKSSHHLRADCIGDRLTFYVDGTLVAQAQDPDPLGGGNGGFYVEAGASKAGAPDVFFDNLTMLAGTPDMLPPQTITTSPSFPYPIVADDFVDNRNGWPESNDLKNVRKIQNGTYQWQVKDDTVTPEQARALLNVNMQDVSLELDVSKITGDNFATVDLRCRQQPDKGSYRFEYGPDGYYGIVKQTATGFIELARHDAGKDNVNTGDAKNHLRLDCVGDELTLYLNGKQVEQVHDDEYLSGSVGFGLYVATDSTFQFDNFVVKSPVRVTAQEIQGAAPSNTTIPPTATRVPAKPTKVLSACNLKPGESGLLISNGYKDTMRFTIGGKEWGTHDYDVLADGKLYLIHMPPGTYTYSASIPGAGKASGEKYEYTLGTCRTIRFTP